MIKGYYPIISNLNDALFFLERGVSVLQLRVKNQTRSQTLECAREISSLKKKFSFCFIVNDDPIIALESNADGVHVGQNDMSVKEVRRLVGQSMLIGLSTHSYEQSCEARTQDINYFAVGGIFPSPTKGPQHPVLGTKFLKQIVAETAGRFPIVAIGGINPSNVEDVWNTGVSAVAAISGMKDIVAGKLTKQ